MVITTIATFNLTDNIIKRLSYKIILLLNNQLFINNVNLTNNLQLFTCFLKVFYINGFSNFLYYRKDYILIVIIKYY